MLGAARTIFARLARRSARVVSRGVATALPRKYARVRSMQLAQQAGLPRRQVVGRRHRGVAQREQIELHQALVVADALGEPRDHLGIGEVAPLREMRHRQVLAHEELGELDLVFGHAEARGRSAGDDRALLGVALAERLADVVQQRAEAAAAPGASLRATARSRADAPSASSPRASRFCIASA